MLPDEAVGLQMKRLWCTIASKSGAIVVENTRKYLWQHSSWTDFQWDSSALLEVHGHCRFEQGLLRAQVEALGLEERLEAQAEVLVEEALKTSAIEGEILDPQQVRSSVARRLGLPDAGLRQPERTVEGLVDILLDATQYHDAPLTADRLKGWQAALFPTGYSGMYKIITGDWRQDVMQVVSGPVGREKVHYEAPRADQLDQQVQTLLGWWNAPPKGLDGLLRAGIAHLWLVTLHPFDDGNGRVGRTLAEMALAADEQLATRYYSLSGQIMAERDVYYDALQTAQQGSGDITEWLQWFMACLCRSMQNSRDLIGRVLRKAHFWQQVRKISLNPRQQKALNKLLDAGEDGFEGGLNNNKYCNLTKTNRTTAFRDLADLVEKGLLVPREAKGRSVSYDLNWRFAET